MPTCCRSHGERKPTSTALRVVHLVRITSRMRKIHSHLVAHSGRGYVVPTHHRVALKNALATHRRIYVDPTCRYSASPHPDKEPIIIVEIERLVARCRHQQRSCKDGVERVQVAHPCLLAVALRHHRPRKIPRHICRNIHKRPAVGVDPTVVPWNRPRRWIEIYCRHCHRERRGRSC